MHSAHYLYLIYEPVHEISNNVVCETSKVSDQPVHKRSLIKPLLDALVFYDCWATAWTSFGVYKLKMRLHRLVGVYTCQNATLLEITCTDPLILSKWAWGVGKFRTDIWWNFIGFVISKCGKKQKILSYL